MANQPKMGNGPAGPSSGDFDSGSIGPAMELLGRMESQVGSIASNRPAEGSASSAADVELNNLREELLATDQRGYEQLAGFTEALEELKHAIPGLIDGTVKQRFLEIEDSFHRNIKEIHSRSIDSFTQSVNSKIGQRLAAMETNLSVHTEAMGQLREHYLKTDRNVQRLMTGLDRLTAELMRISTGAVASPTSRTMYAPGNVRVVEQRAERTERPERYDFRALPQAAPLAEESPSDEANASPQRSRKKKARRRSAFLIPALALFVLVPIGVVGWAIKSGGLLASPAKPAVDADAPLTGVAGQMHMAADFAADKNYAKAESTYRLILKSDSNNREAIKELASVLFRQQRYDEAAAVLKMLPPK
jgi:tetratricopeptide (TPR) repeat protein